MAFTQLENYNKEKIPILATDRVGVTQAETVDLNSLTLEEITAKAQEEGEVNSVGMPDDWANWNDT